MFWLLKLKGHSCGGQITPRKYRTPFVKILLFHLKIPGNPFVLGKSRTLFSRVNCPSHSCKKEKQIKQLRIMCDSCVGSKHVSKGVLAHQIVKNASNLA